MAPKISENFFGPSPSVFIGDFGYPNVFAGPLGALEERDDIDNPVLWIKKDYSDIIELRSLMIRSKKQQSIFLDNKFRHDMMDLSMAMNSPDIEVGFKKKPSLNISFFSHSQPMGPTGDIEKFRVAENPKIPRQIESIVQDDLKANESVFSLYNEGMDVYKITSILSSGALGLKRRLVPTRWSITAADDMIAKSLLKEIREFREIDDILVFESDHLDNHFLIMLMPGAWEFENFEAWPRGSFWSPDGIEQEYEPFAGRKAYAEKQAGGYYASRLAVAEYLHKIRRQSRVLAIREVREGYSVPLGVWQVRENVRDALRREPQKFQEMKSAVAYITPKLRHPFSEYKKRSAYFKQARLTNY